MLPPAVKANVQKIPIFFQKFLFFDLTFATKAMVNAYILLKHKYLQKNALFRWDIKKKLYICIGGNVCRGE